MTGGSDAALVRLVSLLKEASSELEAYRPARTRRPALGDDPTSLLDQCLALCAEQSRQPPEPVRILHHFACTGGTLISKCLAAMPNVQLLSEVDPLSTMQDGDAPGFAPTDLIRLMRQSTRGFGQDAMIATFAAGLAVLKSDCDRRGLRLVLRDHAHSHYCIGDGIPKRPGLRELVAGAVAGPVVSAVTVRHPLDSYLSLRQLGWIVFRPGTFDEYCRRYLAFLADHAGQPRMRYEDFIAAPEFELQRLCRSLQLHYVEGFTDLAGAFRLTGDSGRSAETIAPRPRRPISEALVDEVANAPHYRQLRDELEYTD